MVDEIVVTPKHDGDVVDVSVEQKSAPVEIDSIKVVNLLGGDPNDTDGSSQAKFIRDYFYKEGMTDAELMYAIKSVENRLGTLKMGETRLGKIYEYARLRKEIDTNEKLLNQL
jgi:hypothetical protein